MYYFLLENNHIKRFATLIRFFTYNVETNFFEEIDQLHLQLVSIFGKQLFCIVDILSNIFLFDYNKVKSVKKLFKSVDLSCFEVVSIYYKALLVYVISTVF